MLTRCLADLVLARASRSRPLAHDANPNHGWPAGECGLHDRTPVLAAASSAAGPSTPRAPATASSRLLEMCSGMSLSGHLLGLTPQGSGSGSGSGSVPSWVPHNRRPVYKTELCRFHLQARPATVALLLVAWLCCHAAASSALDTRTRSSLWDISISARWCCSSSHHTRIRAYPHTFLAHELTRVLHAAAGSLLARRALHVCARQRGAAPAPVALHTQLFR